MTVQTSPLYSMNIQTGNQLLKEINKAIQTAQAGASKNAKHPFAMPKAPKQNEMVAEAPATNNGGGDIFSCLIGSLFLDMFFGGMPIMSGMGEATRGLAQIGLMNGVEAAHETQQPRKMRMNPAPQRAVSFDDVLMTAQQTEHLQAVASQTNKMRQMVMLRQMLAMLVAQMMNNMQEEGEGKSGGDGGLVPDVLRDPKLARFKQNRQSISCIRTLFQRQTASLKPAFSGAQYKLVAA